MGYRYRPATIGVDRIDTGVVDASQQPLAGRVRSGILRVGGHTRSDWRQHGVFRSWRTLWRHSVAGRRCAALLCRGTVLAAATDGTDSLRHTAIVSGAGPASGDAGRLGASTACRRAVVATTAPGLAVFAGNAGADEHRERDVVPAQHRTLRLPPARRRACRRPLQRTGYQYRPVYSDASNPICHRHLRSRAAGRTYHFTPPLADAGHA